MEEVQMLKLNMQQIKQIIFEHYNINKDSKLEIVYKPVEDADLTFYVETKEIVNSLEIEHTYIINQDDLNNIIEEKLNPEGLSISNYYYNQGGNRDFKLITYNLKKYEKIKQKTIGGKKNV